MIDPGTIVDGRYKAISRLGAGGMADVFLAEDQQLGRKVALKLLHRRFAEDPGFVERFRREAQAAAGLQHPNVVGVYDRGAFDGTYYIAMEYLPGRTLKQLVRDEAPLDPIRAIDITIQILKAARFAHRRGIVHRDLKPHNVIIDETDHAKVTDFGIARAGASDMTETGSIMGTAQYLSPEQAQGHAVSASSDLYSVAVVLFELLTGRVPFDADAAVTIALKHVSEAPPAVRSLNPSVPPELEQVVMWGLNKNPADRPRDADDFVAALEAAKAAIQAGGGGQQTASIAALSAAGAADWGSAPVRATSFAPQIPPRADPLPAQEAGIDGTEHPGPPPDERRRPLWPWILGAIVLLALAGGGVAAYLLTRPKQVLVPRVVLDQVDTARTVLQNDGFGVNVITETNGRPQGIVFAQNPLSGQKVDKGSTVTLTVSSGPGNATVPAVEGDTLIKAEQQIRKERLAVGKVFRQSSNTVANGVVISTDPPAGQNPSVGSSVNITVSTGKAPVQIPDVTGQSQASATTRLQNAGFVVTTSNQTSSTVKPGDVISMSPAQGSKVASGSTVNLVIAQAPTTAKVPNVQGRKEVPAERKLTAAGFKVTVATQKVVDQALDGVVLSQSPIGGSTAQKNSSVTIVVGNYTAPSTTTTTTTTSTPTTSTTTTSTTTTKP